jgi:hypothetical protein
MPFLPLQKPTLYQPPLQVGATRIIENKGIYLLTAGEKSSWRLRILLDVIVEPKINYKSFKPNEPEQFFGYWELVEGGYVLEQHAIKYLHHQIYRYQNDPAKALFDLHAESILITIDIFNMGGAILDSIPGAPSLIFDPGRPGTHLETPIDEIWIKLVSGCKVAIHTEFLPLPKIDGVPASYTEPESIPSPTAPTDGNSGGNPTPPNQSQPDRPANPPYNPDTNDANRTTPPGVPAASGSWRQDVSYSEPFGDNGYLQVAGGPYDEVITSQIGPLPGCGQQRYRLLNVTRGIMNDDDNCISKATLSGSPRFVPGG